LGERSSGSLKNSCPKVGRSFVVVLKPIKN
jgi:hypothetical protein